MHGSSFLVHFLENLDYTRTFIELNEWTLSVYLNKRKFSSTADSRACYNVILFSNSGIIQE